MVDTPNANGKITVRIAPDGRAFGEVAGEVTVARGSIFLLPGNGGAKEPEAAQKAREEKLLALPMKIEKDTTEILYGLQKTDPQHIITLYAVLGQLTIQGYAGARLNHHDLTKEGATHAGGMHRMKITQTVPKVWIATKRRKRVANQDEPTPPTWREAAMHLYDHSKIPNEYVKWAWQAHLHKQPMPCVVLTAPALVWSKTISFSDGQIFQFA